MLHVMFSDEPLHGCAGFGDAAGRRGRVDHVGVKHLSGPVHHGKLAAHAVSGIKAERDLVSKRRLHQQRTQIQCEVADRSIVGEVGKRAAKLTFHGRQQQPTPAVLNRRTDEIRSASSGDHEKPDQLRKDITVRDGHADL